MQRDKIQKVPTYKIVLLGGTSVGKSCMVNQFVNNYFDSRNEETTDDFREYIKLVNLNKSDPLTPQYCILKLVDLFGIDVPDLDTDPKKTEQLSRFVKNENVEKKDSKQKSNKKGYDDGLEQKDSKQKNPIYQDKKVYGYMFVYDVTKYETLEKVVEFIDFIGDYERKNSSLSNFVSKKMLVGNKIDLKKRDGEKINKILRELVSKHRIQIMDCSAFENTNIDQCFEELARAIYTDVSFEAYEQEQLAVQEAEQEEADKGMPVMNRKKGGKKKKGGFLGCGGHRKDSEDEDENEEREKADDLDTGINSAPQMAEIEGRKCTMF